MKEIKLTDRTDITFNSLLICSVPQLSGGSRDDQISEEGSRLPPGVFFLLFSAKTELDTEGRRCPQLKLSFTTVNLWLQGRRTTDED